MINKIPDLIAFDCDGTLVNDDGIVTPDTKDAVTKMSDYSKMAFASGRSPEGVKEVKEDLGLPETFNFDICFNGALTVDNQADMIIDKHFIKLKDVKNIIDEARKYNVPFYLVGIDKIYSEEEITEEKVEAGRNKQNIVLTDVNTLDLDTEFAKLVISDDEFPELTHYFWNNLDDKLKQNFSIIHPDAKGANIEFLNEKANKGIAIKNLSKLLDIDLDNVMAFGDAGNDLDLIKIVGMGISMGNGIKPVKEASMFVTEDNNHDGIAKVLNPILEKIKNYDKEMTT